MLPPPAWHPPATLLPPPASLPPTSHASLLSLSPWLISSSVRGLMAAPLRVIWGLKEGEWEEERAELQGGEEGAVRQGVGWGGVGWGGVKLVLDAFKVAARLHAG